MDEMERKFFERSTGYAYVFMMTALVIYDFVHNGQTTFISFVLGVSLAIQWGSFEWFKHKADKTDKEPVQYLYTSIALITIVLIFGLVALMFHGK